MSKLKAGWGQADITPRGGPISLCGQFETRITSEILDPMLAVALILEKDGVRSIWVGCDIISAYDVLTDEVEALLLEQLPGFDPVQLTIAGTHIHTGPYIKRKTLLSLTGDEGLKEDPGTLTTAECRRQVAAGICQAVLMAHQNMEESELGFSVAHIITGVNRRVVYKDGTARMYGHLDTDAFSRMESRDGGPSQFLYVHRLSDGALTGVVCNVPCTAQCDESANYVTADYWGVVRGHVQSELGNDVRILPLCRAAGDLSPHPMVDKIAGYDSARWGRQRSLDLGQWIAENIISHRKHILRRYGGDAVLKQYGATMSLPLWSVTEQEYQDACAYLKNPANFDENNKPCDKFGFANAWTRKKRAEEHPTHYEVAVRATRIGDIAFLTLPFELYIEYADRIRMTVPETVVFDVQLACDCLGYLPTKYAVQGGHYSANIFNGLCRPEEGGEMFVEKSIRILRDLF